ncbi:hypothetical protein OAN38_03670 [Candidatus Marinimicrobia bacterium]|jgi:hypothetical protein|nr:hypothetical protein [Candidatus Neomarinimicrobiota bacterium]MDA8753451.1 hypothetical protein [Candidatus Neomarinimicrobiota bacterium]MDC0383923.1 hypothetical protein [Candidatus Neomarinimicrobiota bacterium]MDC0630795.1 hypothetical protein [Candidatus Neomarinimicrobiota bacterium]MDC3246521.1 hypothetical protein [Candidatus Neomarinimicrobiota bacterium]
MKSLFLKQGIIVSLILSSDLIFACATCFGDPNSNAGKGMDMAIITLLGVISPILFAIAAGIISIGLKSKKMNQDITEND